MSGKKTLLNKLLEENEENPERTKRLRDVSSKIDDIRNDISYEAEVLGLNDFSFFIDFYFYPDSECYKEKAADRVRNRFEDDYIDFILEHIEEGNINTLEINPIAYNNLSEIGKLKLARRFFLNPKFWAQLIPIPTMSLILLDFVFFRLDEKRNINKSRETCTNFELLSFFHPSINDGQAVAERVFPDNFFRDFAELDEEYRIAYVDHILRSIPDVPEDFKATLNTDYDLLTHTATTIREHKSGKSLGLELLETHAGKKARVSDIFDAMMRQMEAVGYDEGSSFYISLDDVGSGGFERVDEVATLIEREDKYREYIKEIKLDKTFVWRLISIIGNFNQCLSGGVSNRLDYKKAYNWEKEGKYDKLLNPKEINYNEIKEGHDVVCDENDIWEKYGENANEDFAFIVSAIRLLEITMQHDINIVFEGVEEFEIADILKSLLEAINDGETYDHAMIQGYAILNARESVYVYNKDGEFESIGIGTDRYNAHLEEVREIRSGRRQEILDAANDDSYVQAA